MTARPEGHAAGPAVVPAAPTDVPAILDIYNREIRDGVALWNTSERRLEDMTRWRAARLEAGFPVLVAPDPAGGLFGYGSFGRFRENDGYAATVEHSLYVAPTARRRGVGRALLAALEAEARAQGRRAMIGGVEAGNRASLALHRAQGFEEVGRLPEVGRKFDRWLTLVLVQKRLVADAAQ